MPNSTRGRPSGIRGRAAAPHIEAHPSPNPLYYLPHQLARAFRRGSERSGRVASWIEVEGSISGCIPGDAAHARGIPGRVRKRDVVVASFAFFSYGPGESRLAKERSAAKEAWAHLAAHLGRNVDEPGVDAVGAISSRALRVGMSSSFVDGRRASSAVIPPEWRSGRSSSRSRRSAPRAASAPALPPREGIERHVHHLVVVELLPVALLSST